MEGELEGDFVVGLIKDESKFDFELESYWFIYDGIKDYGVYSLLLNWLWLGVVEGVCIWGICWEGVLEVAGGVEAWGLGYIDTGACKGVRFLMYIGLGRGWS
jgi:hypothetical protein